MIKQNIKQFLAETDIERILELAKIRVEEKLKRKFCMRGSV